jgi:hypothetical protein
LYSTVVNHALGRHGQGGVATGNIGQRANRAAVKAALLLRDLVRVGQGQFAQAGLDPQQAGTEVQHHALALETRAHALEQGLLGGGPV